MKSNCTIKDWILGLTILYINYAVDHPSLIPIQLYCWPCYHPEYSWNTTNWMLSNNQSLNKYLDSNNLYFLNIIFSNSGHFGRSTGWGSIILKQTAHEKKLWKMVRLDFPHVSSLCSVLEHNGGLGSQ